MKQNSKVHYFIIIMVYKIENNQFLRWKTIGARLLNTTRVFLLNLLLIQSTFIHAELLFFCVVHIYGLLIDIHLNFCGHVLKVIYTWLMFALTRINYKIHNVQGWSQYEVVTIWALVLECHISELSSQCLYFKCNIFIHA